MTWVSCGQPERSAKAACQSEHCRIVRSRRNRVRIAVKRIRSHLSSFFYLGKAQREFRKRREARVRELEERCRRFDQMGLEANSELQRVARNMKEENDALRGFIMRMGMGHMIPNLLQGIGQHHQMANGGDEQFFQPAFSGAFSGAFGGSFAEPTFFIDPSNNPDPSSNASTSNTGHGRPLNEGREGAALTNDDASKLATSLAASHQVNTTLAPTPTPAPLQSGSSPQGSRINHRQAARKTSSASPSSSRSANSERDGPLLTLNLNASGDSVQRSGPQQRQQQQQQHSTDQAHAQPSQTWSASDGQDANPSMFANTQSSAGVGGTAMLPGLPGNGFAPFPVPQRSHQNAALLNPNPIPFAFNLSAGDGSQASWWDQVGGDAEPFELDDKAQAVANAQAGAQQAQSPFDLSAFLQGGITPGGGFQLGPVSSNQGDGNQGTPAADVKTGGNGIDTEHMRMFIQLMERKMAERDARTYASLGFQPPSQNPTQRSKQNDDLKGMPLITSMPGQLTPSGVYSRLAQHPAFLSTNVRELEELVDALGPSTQYAAGNGKSIDEEKSSHVGAPQNKDGSPHSTAMHTSLSRSGRSPSSSMHVDEGAIGKLLGLLDQKRGAQFKRFPSDDNQQRLTMAMT